MLSDLRDGVGCQLGVESGWEEVNYLRFKLSSDFLRSKVELGEGGADVSALPRGVDVVRGEAVGVERILEELSVLCDFAANQHVRRLSEKRCDSPV